MLAVQRSLQLPGSMDQDVGIKPSPSEKFGGPAGVLEASLVVFPSPLGRSADGSVSRKAITCFSPPDTENADVSLSRGHLR